jgi:hypothetical protein
MAHKPQTQDHQARRQLHPLLFFGGVTLLAVLAVALALVIASLARELGTDPEPPSRSPIQFSPPVGHPTAQ